MLGRKYKFSVRRNQGSFKPITGKERADEDSYPKKDFFPDTVRMVRSSFAMQRSPPSEGLMSENTSPRTTLLLHLHQDDPVSTRTH